MQSVRCKGQKQNHPSGTLTHEVGDDAVELAALEAKAHLAGAQCPEVLRGLRGAIWFTVPASLSAARWNCSKHFVVRPHTVQAEDNPPCRLAANGYVKEHLLAHLWCCCCCLHDTNGKCMLSLLTLVVL